MNGSMNPGRRGEEAFIRCAMMICLWFCGGIGQKKTDASDLSFSEPVRRGGEAEEGGSSSEDSELLNPGGIDETQEGPKMIRGLSRGRKRIET